MTNQEIQALLDDAKAALADELTELKQTTVGFKNRRWTVPPAGTHWAHALAHHEAALGLLEGAHDALDVTPAPAPTPTPVPTGALPKYGVCPGHASQVWDDSLHTWVMDKMKELAQGKPFAWRVDAGSVNTRLDRDVNACVARGLTPYLIVGGTNRTPSRSAQSWVGQMAAHYKGKGVVYTGPNEPDLNGWDATTLAYHQVSIYDAIKAADPTALIGYGPVWKGSPNAFANWQPYVKQAAAIAKGKFDFFPGHFYDDPAQATVANAGWNVWTWYFKKFGGHAGQTAEDIFAQAGIGVPIVNDESGGKQADPEYGNVCVRVFDQAKQGPIHTSVIYCALPDVPGFNYLLNPDRTERPAYQPLKQFMATA